jgi:dCMP deaminase
MTQPTFVCYLPVFHAGFAQFFTIYPNVKNLIIVPADLLGNFGPFHKDLHALRPEIIKLQLEALQRFDQVTIADADILQSLDNPEQQLIIPDENALRLLADKYFPQAHITWENIFLRWDNKNSLQENRPPADIVLTYDETDHALIKLAKLEGEQSSDWWRRVGAVLFNETSNEIILRAHNQHLPENHTPYINGDVRAQFHKGDHLELTTAIHAEAYLFATCAKLGIKTDGLSLYVTDFPCPPCAKLIAAAGIKHLYYHHGYAVLDGLEILRAFGVEIIKVEP